MRATGEPQRGTYARLVGIMQRGVVLTVSLVIVAACSSIPEVSYEEEELDASAEPSDEPSDDSGLHTPSGKSSSGSSSGSSGRGEISSSSGSQSTGSSGTSSQLICIYEDRSAACCNQGNIAQPSSRCVGNECENNCQSCRQNCRWNQLCCRNNGVRECIDWDVSQGWWEEDCFALDDD